MIAGNRMKWLRWGAVAAPVLLIGVFTVANRLGGPSKARASDVPSTAVAAPHAIASSPKALEIDRWIAERKALAAASPFEAAPDAPDSASISPNAPRSFDGVKLTGVFRSNDTAIAAINGKLLREGQEVSPGVTVTSIDARARKVQLTLTDGRVVELTSGITPKAARQPR